MKLIIAMAALTLVVGCSSKEKKEEVKDDKAKVEESVDVGSTADEDKAAEEKKSEEAASSEEESEPKAEMSQVTVEGEPQSEFPAVEGDVTSSSTCQNGEDSRKIEVISAPGKTPLCGVAYSKFGSTKTVAIANNDESFCTKVADQIKTALGNAGFSCDGQSSQSVPSQPAVEAAPEASASEEAVESQSTESEQQSEVSEKSEATSSETETEKTSK